ncbi:MAG: hypothetical protein BroJett039_08070 [Chloroflexota bacterium]|nr:MAG: hypothetical protein BroJett039_08070 [Chloroflexota bacterium]
MEHEFTIQIKNVLTDAFGQDAEGLYEKSALLQYVNIKTRSAMRGSKARSSFANLYAIYVLVEHYVQNGFHKKRGYGESEGARFTDLLRRQRELPFGSKLQNHALNSRMNEEFKKYFPENDFIPILRDLQSNRYWINENLLRIRVHKKFYNIAPALLAVIERYIETKQIAFEQFIETIERLKRIGAENDALVREFILSLLAPSADARIFEIVSYAILKFYYHDQEIYFGFELDALKKERLKLYKTGRTNANDGGIDFVMRPLGRFFQVTETLDVRKYFLDIDKLEHYPVSFVIKSSEPVEQLERKLRVGAERQYGVKAIVERYMSSVEEVINTEILVQRFAQAKEQGYLRDILNEIVTQSKVEFNYEEEVI